MGYRSQGHGELVFSRPLIWSEFKDHPFADPRDDTTLWFVTSQFSEERPEGTLTQRFATGVRFRYEDESKMYTVTEDMRSLATFLRALGVSASGYLTRIGEESPDIERYWIDEDGRDRSEEAEVRWPSDGTKFEY